MKTEDADTALIHKLLSDHCSKRIRTPKGSLLAFPKSLEARKLLLETDFPAFKCRETNGSRRRNRENGDNSSPNNRTSSFSGPNLFVVIRGIDHKYTDEQLTEILDMPASRMSSSLHQKKTRSIRCKCPTPEAKEKLLAEKFFYFDFSRKPVEDYRQDSPRQCYKCQAFGHTANDCTADQDSCRHCSGPHKSSECKKEEPPKCSNCGGDHPSTFPGCPSYRKAKEDQITTASTYAQKVAKPAPSVEAVRLAVVITDCIYGVLKNHIHDIDYSQVATVVAGVVSPVYKRLVSPSQISPLSYFH
jgi:hypothetical protein